MLQHGGCRYSEVSQLWGSTVLEFDICGFPYLINLKKSVHVCIIFFFCSKVLNFVKSLKIVSITATLANAVISIDLKSQNDCWYGPVGLLLVYLMLSFGNSYQVRYEKFSILEKGTIDLKEKFLTSIFYCLKYVESFCLLMNINHFILTCTIYPSWKFGEFNFTVSVANTFDSVFLNIWCTESNILCYCTVLYCQVW